MIHVKRLIRSRPRNPDGKLTDPIELGAIIRHRRRELELTQAQLARRCGCTQRFISELERGEAAGSIRQVIRICNMLGMDLLVRKRGL